MQCIATHSSNSEYTWEAKVSILPVHSLARNNCNPTWRAGSGLPGVILNSDTNDPLMQEYKPERKLFPMKWDHFPNYYLFRMFSLAG